MKALAKLDEVIRNLQQDENSTRIKKLIFGACFNTWENDLNRLEAFQLKDLLQKLVELNPSIENLKISLNKVVQTLNKPGEYGLIANVIINYMEKLYENTYQPTQIASNQPNYSGLAAQSVANQTWAVELNTNARPNNPPYDLFEMRLEIMRYTNPLRAKILIFSTLYQQLDINEKDLLIIRAHELDDLLLKLFYFCQTITEMDARLSSTARCLFEADENYQAASAIVQAMKPFYANRQPGMYPMPVLDRPNTDINLSVASNEPPKTNNFLADEGDSTHQVR
ncbi:MAG TPA: hypothetical protein V6D28_07265 [Leptolyngbyaceae cyanobacterium]